MIYSWYWTVVVLIGTIGAARNLMDRNANIKAARAKHIRYRDFRVALVFRNSEILRLVMVLIMLLVGLMALYINYWPTAWLAPWIAKHFGDVVGLAFCVIATILTLNIWYFGNEGRQLMGKRSHDKSNQTTT